MNRFFLKFLIFLMMCICTSLEILGQSNLQSEVQRRLLASIEKTLPSTVRLVPYDSISKSEQSQSQFSGVVVEKEGIILTAAHAASPKKLYHVYFPDGKMVLAKGLGRIPKTDMAMIKISNPGPFPFTPIRSGSLPGKGQAVLSISSPFSLQLKEKPSVRLGVIADTLTENGLLQSTCLMEPGDSGGALFDLEGFLVGIHSRINADMNENFEVPAFNFRNYWDTLLVPITHIKTPIVSLKGKVVYDTNAIVLPFDENGIRLTGTLKEGKNATIDIVSELDGKKNLIKGTVISLDYAPKHKNRKFIVSKSSEIGDNARIMGGGADDATLEIIKRDEQLDLVCLSIKELEKDRGIYPIRIKTEEVEATRAGTLLMHPLPEGTFFSILGTQAIDVPDIQETGMHVASQFKGGTSKRAGNFKGVYSCDARLVPSDCGSPVWTLDGEFFGISIARYSRSSTLVVSAATLLDFLETFNK